MDLGWSCSAHHPLCDLRQGVCMFPKHSRAPSSAPTACTAQLCTCHREGELEMSTTSHSHPHQKAALP